MLKINERKIYRYLGGIHIHSKHSDGSGDVDEISRAAKKAGLDFIIITDHNNMDIEEGYFNGVCVIKGEEISPYYQNHYVALGTENYIEYELPAQEFIKEVREQGGFGFAAHPDESDYRKNKYKPIKWLDKNIAPDGVEIWNWFSSWADGYCDKNIFTIAYSYFFKDKLVTKPKQETLQWWDTLNNNQENIIPAIGGVDAHALKIHKYILPLTIFPYEEMFKTITNVITLNNELSKDFKTVKKQIIDALNQGKNLIVNRKINKNIPLVYISNAEKTAFCGESVNFNNNCLLNVSANSVFDVRLICNGIVIFNEKVKSLKFPITQKGKYRVELSKGRYGFGYSNPIVVT